MIDPNLRGLHGGLSFCVEKAKWHAHLPSFWAEGGGGLQPLQPSPVSAPVWLAPTYMFALVLKRSCHTAVLAWILQHSGSVVML